MGLITSPILANIYLKTFDNILYGKLKKLGLENIIYTRYADDLTISFKNPNEWGVARFNEELTYIEEVITKQLKKYRLKLNLKKKSIINLKVSNHVRITGISITKITDDKRRLSVGKKRINKLYDDALQLYIKNKIKTMYLLMKIFTILVELKEWSHLFYQYIKQVTIISFLE